MLQKEQWNGFEGRLWKEEINVRDFVQNKIILQGEIK